MMVFIIPAVYGVSIELVSPSVIIQGETESASFVIESNYLFNGIVNLDYDNVQSFTDYVPILNNRVSLAVEIPVDKIVASADMVGNTFEKIHERMDNDIDRAVKSAQINMIIAYIIIILIISLIGQIIYLK